MPLERLRQIMRRLRDPVSGCEWDTAQTFETIAPYTIEEAYEVADAIASNDSALAGVALALPALERAAKLQRRAARIGFDWPDTSGPRAKIDEELAELDAESDHHRMFDELGDLLFAVVNLARHVNIEPEA